jgi:hypothetical protein
MGQRIVLLDAGAVAYQSARVGHEPIAFDTIKSDD